MPEVQSIGAADYALPTQQNQYSNQSNIDENIPMVYDPDVEAKRRAASNKLGLTLLGVALLAGGLIGGHAWGKSGKSELKQANDAMKEVLNDLNNESKKVSDEFLGGFQNGKKFAKSVQEKAKPFIEDVEKTAEDVAEKAEEVAEKNAKKTEEAVK